MLIEAEQEQQDPTEPFSQANRHATRLVQERFGKRKHVKHLQAFFALLRRRRLLSRLRAIEAALHLVNGLVAQEETLSHQLLSAIHQVHREPEQSTTTSPTEPPAAEPSQRIQLCCKKLRRTWGAWSVATCCA